MSDIRQLRDIAADLVPHFEMRRLYVKALPKDVHHIDVGRMILGERLSGIVEGKHRPFDILELLDTIIAASAHFAVAHDTKWDVPGPQLVKGQEACAHGVPLSEPCAVCRKESSGSYGGPESEDWGRRSQDGGPTSEPGAVVGRIGDPNDRFEPEPAPVMEVPLSGESESSESEPASDPTPEFGGGGGFSGGGGGSDF